MKLESYIYVQVSNQKLKSGLNASIIYEMNNKYNVIIMKGIQFEKYLFQ